MTEQAHVGAPVLEAENLSIQFGGLKALQELSFSIPEKTVFSIIGPNGAGKTTFFNIVTGIYRPTGGDVRLYGESIVGLEPSRIVERGVCRTFQNIRLFQNLTVLENVMIGRQLHERTGLGDILLRTRRFRAQEAETLDRAAEILDYVGILDDANALAKNLPYGRQRRLEIARALAAKPKLLLLDEPAAGMNPQETKELMEMISWIRREFGLTILLIEHDMSLVMRVCERIQVINFGQTIAAGLPEEIASNQEVIEAYLGKKEEEGAC